MENYKKYQQCTRCVMDTIGDNDIYFNDEGICNYCTGYAELERKTVLKGEEGLKAFRASIDRMKKDGAGRKYDCILGISGGVDSTYLAYLCKRENLRPLLVHFDNGWNSELAVKNIENILKHTGFDLYTYVMDWEEFKDLQRSYLLASVIDIEVPTDQLIFGALNSIAHKYHIKYILSGLNTATEAIMPPSWNYSKKYDSRNLRSIHRAFSKKKLRKLPLMGFWNSLFNQVFWKVQTVTLLNYVDYNKKEVKDIIHKELGWTDYGGKHFESVFTRFYQGYILPVKFNVDKRKAHLSNLICSGQLTRKEALEEMRKPTYDTELQKQDKVYVAKKLNFTQEEFEMILRARPISHNAFESDDKLWNIYFGVIRALKPIKPVIKFAFAR